MVIWLGIFVAYFIFLLLLISGLLRWRKSQHRSEKLLSVSVVVAMRNEALNLKTLIASLSDQDYSGECELILVDDHSEDNSLQVATILKYQYSDLNITLLHSTGDGKKQALTTGIETATGELILTTDADCELQPEWISDMVNSFDEQIELVAGAVSFKPDASFFGSMQAVEFASIMATGFGMLGWGKPIMCNGASLAFRKSAFVEVNGYSGNEHIPSGDDEFLMRKIAARFPGSIRAMNFGNNICRTRSSSSVSEFFDQRIRWAGKWKANTSWLAKLLAVFILMFQIIWLPAVAIALFTQSPVLLSGVILKILLEFILLSIASKSIQQPFSLPAFLALQILYSPYIIVVALASQLIGYRWKNRTVLASRQ